MTEPSNRRIPVPMRPEDVEVYERERRMAIERGDYVRSPLEPGMCGEDVWALQENINRLGLRDRNGQPIRVDPDGEWGMQDEAMSEAVRELQAELQEYRRNRHQERLGEPLSSVPLQEDRESWRDRAPMIGGHAWLDMEELMERRGQSTIRPGNGATTFFQEPGQDGMPVPAPRSRNAPGGCVPVAEGGGEFHRTVTNDALSGHPVYAAIRRQLPEGIPDNRAAEVALRAVQDGIETPGQIRSVTIQDDRIFVAGTTPGFRAQVDLRQPAPPMSELNMQLATANQAGVQQIDAPAHSHGTRSLI